MFNYWNWKDKEKVRLREEIQVELVQFKLEHHLVFKS